MREQEIRGGELAEDKRRRRRVGGTRVCGKRTSKKLEWQKRNKTRGRTGGFITNVCSNNYY